MPFGPLVLADDNVLFRLWAPSANSVNLCLENQGTHASYSMDTLPGGWFQKQIACVKQNALYRFHIDSNLLVPDPASRAQFDDIHGPSIVIDPADFPWHDDEWHGKPWEETIIYEIHTGTFSPEGTFAGITKQLHYLAELGVTAIELMPVADFPGTRNWGYDGALLFAPDRSYGSPNELKQLVQAAHGMGIMVFLDVVYNHFGPEGNYLHVYAGKAFFTQKHQTPWGAAINFSGRHSRTVRDFFIHNALYWLEEYRFDGLRLDAVHAIFDESEPHILEEIAASVRAGPGKTRQIHLMLENDNNQSRYLCRDQNGVPNHYVSQWNDDLHHACHVLLTGEKAGYYADYADEPLNHLGRCLTEGFAYQGEPSRYRHHVSRGEKSSHLPPQAFLSFLQNHDQVGNRALGERLTTLTAEPLLHIAAALTLLAPSPPLLFMGEEFGATTPFLFFCNFGEELIAQVTEGRRQEFAEFPEFSDPEAQAAIPDPQAIDTYHRSCLNWLEKECRKGHRFSTLYRKLLTLRHDNIVPRLAGTQGGKASYQTIEGRALRVAWILGDGSLLQVVVNFTVKSIDNHPPLSGERFYADSWSAQYPVGQHVVPAQSIAWFLDK